MKTATGLFIAAVAILCGFAVQAFAQTAPTRFELGAQLSTLRLTDFKTTSPGLGGRLTFNATRLVSIEGEFNFFPHDNFTTGGGVPGFGGLSYERRRAEGLFGPKIGVRGDRFGVFGRVRPGFTRLIHKGVGCNGEVCALMLIALPEYKTEFALDLGGTFEFYPTQRTVARFDVGQTRIQHRSSAPPCFAGCTSQNLSSNFSLGLRF